VKNILAVFVLGLFAVANSFGQTPYKVLIFSETLGFRHDSISNGIATIQALGTTNSFTADATEDPTLFTDANLAQYKALIFLNTTGDVLDTNQQGALQRYIEAGGGWVGIHSAADTLHNWAWYGGLVGSYFASHPAIQQATVKVADRVDPSTSMLPKRWVRTDEWYNFQTNPRGTVHVLATVDETTYTGGTNGFDHPIAWCQNYDGGRAWYTAGGHTAASFDEPLFQAHLLGGIQFAAGVKLADPGSTLDSNFQKVILDNNVSDPLQLSVAADGRVFYIERGGNVKIYNPVTSHITVAGHINVEEQVEDGLLGIALDTGFSTNNWFYLFYSPNDTNSEQHISRFTLTSSNTVDLASEKILVRIPTIRGVGNHSAGCLFMHTNGDLYISAGDNTDPFSSSGFAPLDEQPGRAPWDSEKSASNENDLRGKISRIHPQPDGTYIIPAGNLFPPGTPNTKPEIYVMGCRNPFRFSVDEATGWLYWGEVGPDATADDPTRGPKGYDEWNQARSAGNFGWPYFVANNKPYIDYDFATGISGAAFDPNAPVNDSPNNTGPANLPPAQPAWLWYPYDSSVEFPELDGSGGRTAMGGPVYHFKSNVNKATKLPAYYDNTLFIWEWSRDYIKEIKIDDDGSVLKINPFLPSFAFSRPIDMKIGPDGVIYMIEWGTGFNGSNPDAKLVRIDYVGGNHAPVALAQGVPDNGSLPLTVQFSSTGTHDPEGDPISLAWSFMGDGTTNSTAPAPSFTYTTPGNFQAQLTVTDSHGNQTVANVPISAGNNRPVVSIQQPPNGAIFDWGKALPYQISVYDIEDGSTTNGTINCSNVIAAPLLGHNDHAHGEGIYTGCSGVFTAPVNTDSDSDNLFLVLNANYADKGAPGVASLMGTASYIFPPRHKQAEFCTTNSNVSKTLTADPAGGGLDISSINHGSFIGLWPVNLTNIYGITFRVASSGVGGRIETHIDSTNGPLISTATVPPTGGIYTNIAVPITDPGGTHTLYFVFLRNPGDKNLFVLNWLEFQGPGLALSPAPFGGNARPLPGIVQSEDFDDGGEGVAYHDSDASNNGGQYRSTGVDIENTADTGGGYDVSWTTAGEWLNYTVNANSAGLYTISVRAASPVAGGTFHIEFNGINKTGPMIIPNTGGAQSWQTLSVNNVLLDAGLQSMRVILDVNNSAGVVGNFNFVQATLTLSNTPPTVALTAPPDEATYSSPMDVTLSANASDPDSGGSVRKVDFYASGALIGTVSNAPYTMVWSNATAGNYLIEAKATDNIGSTTTSASRTIRIINGEASFTGSPQTVPGTIQAENFDGGGEGVAYHDSDTANNGGAYRNTAVDLETTGDAGGGYDLGWTAGGEWVNYTINAAIDGLYALQVRTASSGNGGTFHIEIDGVNKSGPMTNSDSGGWQTWRTLSNNIGITAGPHVMRLVEDTSGANGTVGNFNYFTLTAIKTNPAPVLAHRYSFEGGPGTTLVADSIGNANGTSMGGATFTGNGQLNLSGSSAYVNLPNGLISGLTNVTLEAWVTWNGGAAWQRIFDFGSSSAGENNQGTGLTYFMLTPQSGSGLMRFAMTTNSSSGEAGLQGPGPFPIGQPTHVAVSYDFLAGTAVLYENGQRITNGSAVIPLSGINDVNVWLGKSQWADPYFNGQFDEFRIYNGAVSDAGIAASFAAGPNALTGPLPALNVAASGNSVVLSWPLSAPGFTVEYSTNLQSGSAWTPITTPPVLQNGQHVITVPLGNSNLFFRLQQ
jgi:glucose/arabinose dehydrogenase